MSRLTGTDAYSLMEAYNNVYAPQELTEEQVWEEVETWVNSLIEEGYDLSDYTWEEMYESYLSEDLMGDLRANAGNIVRGATGAYQGAMRTASNVNQAVSDRIQRNIKPKPAMPGLPPSAAQPGGPNSNRVGTYTSRFAGSRDAAFARAQNIKGSPVVGPRPSPATPAAKPSAGAPARTATAPAKPVATAPATPKPTTATATPTPAPSTSPARPSLSSQADEIRQMRAKSLQRQGKTLDAATVSGATRPAYQANSFDVFDVIKGHLIDEGYADTEESALVIMANMSEEWRQSIVEGFPNVQNKPRPGDAGTSGLKMIQTPGGQRGYINKHSGGEILPSGTVNKIMGGNLMVKNGTKKNTNSNIA